MLKKFRLGLIPMTILALLLLAGCGGATETQDGGADVGATSDATGADADEAGGEPLAFTVAVVDPDIASVPLLAAIESLRDDGHAIESVEVAEPELAIEGLARNEFQFSGESISPALIAIQRGAPLQIIGDVVANPWAIYADETVAECADLHGKPFGIFSEGSVATAMARQWIEAECPGTEPEYLVLGGSDIRLQALLAGEINATALSVEDIVVLEQEAPGGFNLLANFAERLPDLRPSTLYGNADFIEENPEATTAFLAAVAEQHEMINADPQYLEEIVLEHLPETDEAVLEDVAQRYVEGGLFDVGGLNESNLEFTINFFEEAGVIEPGLTPEDVADLSYVQAAVEGLDNQ